MYFLFQCKKLHASSQRHTQQNQMNWYNCEQLANSMHNDGDSVDVNKQRDKVQNFTL